jgi:hypothetical protein
MFRNGSYLLAAAVAISLIAPLAYSDSQVRIVRLSYVDGGIQIDRGSGYERAFLNLPISQGTRLRSAEGRAEVEFEDGSTMHITPKTEVEFSQLSRRDSGEKVSTMQVLSGTVYLNYTSTRHDEFAFEFGQQKVTLASSAYFRLGVTDTSATLAVFKGDLHVQSVSGPVEVKKNQTISFAEADGRYTLTKNIEKLPLDSWAKEQNEFHDRYAGNQNNSPYAYGRADLRYYGSFFDAPGYGMLWRPYFVDSGWDPFMDGAWMYNPGWGYGWVSAYPWGWTPYHYGSWVFVSGFGWAWQPGGVWMPWYTQPTLINAPSGFTAPKPPRTGESTVVVNRGPISAPTQSGNKMLIRNDSAGLGIRRGEIHDLAKASRQVEAHGTATRTVQITPGSAQPFSHPHPTSHPSSGGMQGSSRPSMPPSAPPMSHPMPAPAPAPSHAGGPHR